MLALVNVTSRQRGVEGLNFDVLPMPSLGSAKTVADLMAVIQRWRAEQRTVVAVLHDLNHACRYADEIVVMKSGRVVARGVPGTLMTSELVEDVYGLRCQIIDDPQTGTPLIVPRASPHLTDGR